MQHLCATIKMTILGALFSSVGRAGVPCAEALSSLLRPQVGVPAVGHSPSLSSCFRSFNGTRQMSIHTTSFRVLLSVPLLVTRWLKYTVSLWWRLFPHYFQMYSVDTTCDWRSPRCSKKGTEGSADWCGSECAIQAPTRSTNTHDYRSPFFGPECINV